MNLGISSPTFQPTFSIKAVNIGEIPVTLDSIPSIRLPDNMYAHLVQPLFSPKFPYKLHEHGGICQIIVDVKRFAKNLGSRGYSGEIEIIGRFGDSADNYYESEPIIFDIDSWISF